VRLATADAPAAVEAVTNPARGFGPALSFVICCTASVGEGKERVSMKAAHQNLCEYAEDEQSLYRLWDEDLRKTMRRRDQHEFVALALLLLAFALWEYGKPDVALISVFSAIACLFRSLKFMIDESNTNYLMHRWDLEAALRDFRSRHLQQRP
jgi:hypothetical protein